MPGNKQQTPEHKAKIAEALVLVSQGHTLTYAAKATGLSRPTVTHHYRKIVTTGSEKDKLGLDGIILGYAYQIADLTGAQMVNRLEDPDQATKMPTKDVMRSYGIATDKIAAWRGWNRPQDQGAEGFLHKLTESMSRVRKVTLELADPAEQAIDITPTDVPPPPNLPNK